MNRSLVRTLALGSIVSLAACGGDPADEPTPPRHGVVSLVQTPLSSAASARWVDASEPAPGWSCERRTEGSCVVEICTGAFPDHPSPWPGDVTINGETSCTLTSGARECFSESARFWDAESPGQVTVSTAGSDVLPAFSVTLDAPRAPALESPTTPMISRESDLEVRWGEGGSGTIHVIGGGWSSLRARSATIECEVPVSDRALVVPRSAIAELTNDHPIAIMVRRAETRDVGGYRTVVSAAQFLTQVYAN